MKAWPVRSSATPRDGHLRFGRVHRGQLVATELLLAPRLGGQDAVARSDRRPRGRRVAPPGFEPGLPNPERRPADQIFRQIVIEPRVRNVRCREERPKMSGVAGGNEDRNDDTEGVLTTGQESSGGLVQSSQELLGVEQ